MPLKEVSPKWQFPFRADRQKDVQDFKQKHTWKTLVFCLARLFKLHKGPSITRHRIGDTSHQALDFIGPITLLC